MIFPKWILDEMNAFSKLKITFYSIYSAIKARGLIKTLQMVAVALRDRAEDKARGLEAHEFVDSASKTRGHPSSAHANYYQPIRSAPFRKLLNRLAPNVGYNFVDIGAGTGKAMILAAEYGFATMRGAELVKDLCEVANENFRKFSKIFPGKKFSIHHADALAFKFEEKDAFFLLNDPFSEEIFRPFLDRLKAFSKEAGHEILLVYKNNNLRNIPSLHEFKKHCSGYCEIDLSGNFFQVYAMNGPPSAQTSIS